MSPRIKPESRPLPRPVASGSFDCGREVWAGLADAGRRWASAPTFSGSAARRTVARDPQYQLTADEHSHHAAAAVDSLRYQDRSAPRRRIWPARFRCSMIGTSLSRRVKDAFEFHPWVASVERITRRLPSSLDIELKYRRPIAAVESSDVDGVMFLPIDEHAVRLPEGDLTEAERRYLPRISGITGRPLVGDRWDDPRVVGGAKLAAAAGRCLAAAAARGNHRRRRNRRRTTRRKSTRSKSSPRGGTRIVWGMTPGEEASTGESPFDQKRQRLLDYAAQHGKLESIDGPAVLDVRSELVVTPRTARNKKAAAKRRVDTQTK